MIRNNKMPYEAPTLVSVILEAGNNLCNLSTGERFGGKQDYSDNWEEED